MIFLRSLKLGSKPAAILARVNENRLDIDLGLTDNKLDIYHCGNSNALLLLFLHGGYWQVGVKSQYRFVAKPYIVGGVDAAYWRICFALRPA